MNTNKPEGNVQTDNRYHFNVGSYKCIAIRDDSEEFPLTDITADVPVEEVARAVEELGHPTAGWRVDYNHLLIVTGRERVLVDTGWGRGTWPRKGRLLQNLQAEGIAPADIDWIATTHWDLDHIGGTIDIQEGKAVFPNARYAMWRTAWEFWSNTDWSEWSEATTAVGTRILQLPPERIELVEPETEFLPGFRFVPATGHRPDHTTLTISSDGEHLVHAADTLIHPLLIVHPDWTWPYHSAPEQAASDQRRILEWAEDHNALIFATHFPFPGLCRVRSEAGRWHWQPVVA